MMMMMILWSSLYSAVLLGGWRLLQKLIESQLVYQDLLKLAIDDKQQQTDQLRWTTLPYLTILLLLLLKQFIKRDKSHKNTNQIAAMALLHYRAKH